MKRSDKKILDSFEILKEEIMVDGGIAYRMLAEMMKDEKATVATRQRCATRVLEIYLKLVDNLDKQAEESETEMYNTSSGKITSIGWGR